ncbi:hypothetical protein CHUAL_012518 [Chamberlinius hualienensis]
MYWLSQEMPEFKLAENLRFFKVIAIAEKIYVFIRLSSHKTKIFKLDSETLTCSKFTPINNGNFKYYKYCHHHINPYKHYILVYIHTQSKIHRIDTVTRQIEEIDVTLPSLLSRSVLSTCVVGDELLIFCDERQNVDLYVLNLTTFRYETRNTCHPFQCDPFLAVYRGTDVYCFSETYGRQKSSEIYLFKFVINKWLKISIEDGQKRRPLYIQSAFIKNNQLFALHANENACQPCYYLMVMDLSTHRWILTFPSPSLPLKEDFYIAGCIANNRIFALRRIFIEENVSSEIVRERSIPCIYYFDRLPPLQTLCEITAVNYKLNTSHLPEVLQNSIEQYQVSNKKKNGEKFTRLLPNCLSHRLKRLISVGKKVYMLMNNSN